MEKYGENRSRESMSQTKCPICDNYMYHTGDILICRNCGKEVGT